MRGVRGVGEHHSTLCLLPTLPHHAECGTRSRAEVSVVCLTATALGTADGRERGTAGNSVERLAEVEVVDRSIRSLRLPVPDRLGQLREVVGVSSLVKVDALGGTESRGARKLRVQFHGVLTVVDLVDGGNGRLVSEAVTL